MDLSLNLTPPTLQAAFAGPLVERQSTTRVTPTQKTETGTTLPSDKPFVAQVVSARLSGTDYPENPAEIAPEGRTLRPYGVPMLPFVEEADGLAPVAAASTAAPPDSPEPQQAA